MGGPTSRSGPCPVKPWPLNQSASFEGLFRVRAKVVKHGRSYGRKTQRHLRPAHRLAAPSKSMCYTNRISVSGTEIFAWNSPHRRALWREDIPARQNKGLYHGSALRLESARAGATASWFPRKLGTPKPEQGKAWSGLPCGHAVRLYAPDGLRAAQRSSSVKFGGYCAVRGGHRTRENARARIAWKTTQSATISRKSPLRAIAGELDSPVNLTRGDWHSTGAASLSAPSPP
jgi:hypothetical protein